MSDENIKQSVIAVRINKREKEMFKKFAENLGTTMSELIRTYIEKSLEIDIEKVKKGFPISFIFR